MIIDEYQTWMKMQIRSSAGERRSRLEDHGHAEQLFAQTVWLPVVGNFEHLHAEYEVRDFKDGVRFIDYAYIRPPHRIVIEIDGFGPHGRDISRRDFSDDRRRQNHLVLDRWIVLRFSYDDIKDHPRMCQQIILQMLGSLYGSAQVNDGLSIQQREILRLIDFSSEPIKPADVAAHLHIGIRPARKLLKALLSSGHIDAVGGSKKIHRYKRKR